MDAKFILIIIAIFSLLLTGCGPGTDDVGVDLSTPFIGGDVGLNAYLLEGIPPPVIQDAGQTPFSYAIVLENQGEADVGVGTANPFVEVSLEGINPTQWGLDQQDMFITLPQILRGARKNFDGSVLPGEITSVSFEQMTYVPNIRGNIPFTIRANICYDYSTISTTKLCIKDRALENIQDASICSITGEKFPQNSGGPVHVTSLVQNPLSMYEIQVVFVIEHVGHGEFYGRDLPGANSTETCNPSPTNSNKYWVDVTVGPFSDQTLDVSCPRFGGGNRDRVKLFQGAPQKINCIVSLDNNSVIPSRSRIFQELLDIQLDYRYGQFIETPIIVQDVGNEPMGITGP